MRTQKKQRVETFGDPWVVKQHQWNTEPTNQPTKQTNKQKQQQNKKKKKKK